MNKSDKISLTIILYLVFAVCLYSCGESQQEQWIRESEMKQDSLRNAYYEDSLKNARIEKFMRDANCDRNEATKTIDEIYYK